MTASQKTTATHGDVCKEPGFSVSLQILMNASLRRENKRSPESEGKRKTSRHSLETRNREREMRAKTGVSLSLAVIQFKSLRFDYQRILMLFIMIECKLLASECG